MPLQPSAPPSPWPLDRSIRPPSQAPSQAPWVASVSPPAASSPAASSPAVSPGVGRSALGAQRGRVLALWGASGGVGVSCLAAAVATRAARRGAEVVCVETAGLPWGDELTSGSGAGGLAVVCDLVGMPGVRWADVASAEGRIDGRGLLGLLPRTRQGVAVLVGDPAGSLASAGTSSVPPPTAAPEVLTALAEVADLLVVDAGVTPLGWVPSLPVGCDDAVLVVGGHVPALGRAALVAPVWEGLAAERVWVAPRGPRGRGDLADAVAEGLRLPLLVQVWDDPAVDRALARGEVPGVGRGLTAESADRILTTVLAQRVAA